MLKIELLDARQGDAIVVSWGMRSLTHKLLVDMGTPGLGKELHEQLANTGAYELLVVTHIDSDHIGGIVSCLVDGDPIPGVTFKEVWFNGLGHVAPQIEDKEEVSPEQGSKFAEWLGKHPKWNKRFKGGAVLLAGKPRSFKLPGKLVVTVLGPTRARLDELAPTWIAAMTEVIQDTRVDVEETGTGSTDASAAAIISDIEEAGARVKQQAPRLRSHKDLADLAGGVTGDDDGAANGSSIVLLIEHGKHTVLLAGDAYAADLVAAIEKLGRKRPLRLEALKLPHHGSCKNVTRALVEAVDCPLFLFSTNGVQFQHPDNEAVACVINHSPRRPVQLGFNYKSEYTGWWENRTWSRKFEYETTYGMNGRLSITFPRKATPR